MSEYTDVLQPVRVCGYASIYDQPYDIGDGLLESVAPDAFNLSGSVFITADHDHDRRFASTDAGSLELWSDRRGLAFQFAVQNSWGGLNLLRTIATGRGRGASVWFTNRYVQHETIGGYPVDRVISASIAEISITDSPCCTGTAVWHTGEDPDNPPPRIAEARWRWIAGRQATINARHRAQARAKVTARGAASTRHLIPAIDAVLARYRPDLLRLART